MKRLVITLIVAACGANEAPPARSPQQRSEDSAPAVSALQSSHFDQAGRAAEFALGQDPRNARAAAVHAIATYRAAGAELFARLEHVIDSAEALKAFDHGKGRDAWLAFLAKLEAVERDLAVVAADPDFSLELCLACWEHDWNHTGEVDERDRKLFEIEFDGQGGEIAASDPRRRPTFRFDVGDAVWARAMIAFQRAAVEIILAYKWSELDQLFKSELGTVVIHIDDKSRVRRARELVLAGLDHADRCRAAYLAETDDDREWVPNPQQKNFAMPLAVDDQLFDTWHDILGDVRRMLKSEEGISFRETQEVAGDFDEVKLPNAFLDIGAMLRDPKDIVIDLRKLEARTPDVEGILKGVLGNGYRKSMKPSPIVGRIRRMKAQLERGDDTFERKLRYLLWLN